MVSDADWKTKPQVYFPFSECSVACGPLRPRLVCLPWAGGIAAFFRSWNREFGDVAQVLAAEMPGHGVRFGEPCIDIASVLATDIADALLALPSPSTPLLIYGHSMGALLAFETARILSDRSAPLLGLVLSGCHAPHWRGVRRQRAGMSDGALVEELRRMGGTVQKVLDDPELLSILLPILRADFRLAETYLPALSSLLPKLKVPVDVIGGTNDEENPPASLRAWEDLFSGPVQVSLWEGGHFFIEDHRPALLALIGDRLIDWARTTAAG